MNEKKDICSHCYFYDNIDSKEKTIYCILWDERKSQFDWCKEWRKHKNDLKHIKLDIAKEIRKKYEKEQQNKISTKQHKETIKWQKITIIITIIGLIIAAIGLIVL
jgi:hypothetical protein